MLFLQFVAAPICLLGILACIGYAYGGELGPWLGWRLKRLAWPYYACEQCVGQDRYTGCYCSYHGCVHPCEGPAMWRVWLRHALRVVGVNSL